MKFGIYRIGGSEFAITKSIPTVSKSVKFRIHNNADHNSLLRKAADEELMASRIAAA